MERFSDEAWAATRGLRAAIDALPFIAELSDGTLSRPRFQTYITQDALYLGQFGRALAIAGAKAPDTGGLEGFLKWALGAVVVETEVRRTYLGQFGVAPAAAAKAEAQPRLPRPIRAVSLPPPIANRGRSRSRPSCRASGSSIGTSAARSRRQAAVGNRYQAWIDTYAGDEFGDAVQAMIAPPTPPPSAAATGAAREDARRLSPAPASTNTCSGTARISCEAHWALARCGRPPPFGSTLARRRRRERHLLPLPYASLRPLPGGVDREARDG